MSWKLIPILVILLIILYFVPGLQAGFWAVLVILLLIGLMWGIWELGDPVYYS